jgi:exopolysaccharide biosynthesis polyprenyl glycosylphosphotransferase
MHTGRLADGVLVGLCVVLVASFVEERRLPIHLMPLAATFTRALVPAAGILLAYLIGLAFKPLPPAALETAALGGSLVLAVVAAIAARFAPSLQARVAVIGHPAIAQALASELEDTGTTSYRLVGWIDPGVSVPPEALHDRLAGIDELDEAVHCHSIDLLINASLGTAEGEVSRLEVLDRVAGSCLRLGVRLISANQFFEELFGHVPLATMNSAFFEYLMHPRFNAAPGLGKRALDVGFATLMGVALAPLVAVAALAVKLSDRGPAFYRQHRVGERGYEFEVVKLRTMCAEAEADGQAQWSTEDDARITRIGALLRRTHIDEVPQLWNVFRGDMSLVGPRPERPEMVAQLELQVPFYDRRELVRPGITGWAQVRCGYAGSEEGTAMKLCHDLYYLKHRSALLDLMIMLETTRTTVRDVRFGARRPSDRFVLDAVRSA